MVLCEFLFTFSMWGINMLVAPGSSEPGEAMQGEEGSG